MRTEILIWFHINNRKTHIIELTEYRAKYDDDELDMNLLYLIHCLKNDFHEINCDSQLQTKIFIDARIFIRK